MEVREDNGNLETNYLDLSGWILPLPTARVADEINFWQDSVAKIRILKTGNWIRILLAHTKNQFKHKFFYVINQIS